jgi:hypothetical protein
LEQGGVRLGTLRGKVHVPEDIHERDAEIQEMFEKSIDEPFPE